MQTVPVNNRESGQILIPLLLMMALFVFAVVGFAVDLTSLWFHRQAAQAAADSACQAGAMDMSATVAGLTLPRMGFTPGTAGNCSANPGGAICFYANANGYNGTGLVAGAASNSVAWSFPSTVPGTTPPPASMTNYPFLKTTVTENVKTHFFFTLNGTQIQTVAASCTCGLVQEKEAAPMIVLNPTVSGAFTYGGGGRFTIVGGPQRSLQVNSTSPTAIDCVPSGLIDTTHGGPSGTGSDVAAVGGPTQSPSCPGGGFHGGTTGHWNGNVLPVRDPYASVGPPVSVKSIAPASTTSGTWVKYHQDGCPDNSGSTGNPNDACKEFSPGYYPNGLNIDSVMNNYSTAIFLPGVYYLNGSLTAGGSTTLRMATPCNPSCSPLSSTVGQQTDGMMIYFYSGSIALSGCSGCANSDDPVNSTALTCDGSPPNASLGMPASINGNILVAQCATNGTYWDAGGDTTDTRGSPGSRGILVYQDHSNTKTQASFTGSGSLSFSGSLYFHSTSYSDVLSLNGGSSTGDFILGLIVTDQANLSGSGAINLALNPTPSIYLLKVGMLQ